MGAISRDWLRWAWRRQRAVNATLFAPEYAPPVCSPRAVEKALTKQPPIHAGFGRIRLLATGELLTAELQCYEAHGVGKVELKIKEIL